MKKSLLVFLLLILTVFFVFIIVSCAGGVIGFNLTQAKAAFVTWIGNQAGVPPEAVGAYVGAFNAGDLISSENPAPVAGISPRQSPPMTEAGWLFYLDEQPGAFYSHPGKIFAVGQSGQILFSENTQGWPTINGTPPDYVLEKASTRIASETNTITVYNPSHVYVPVGIIRWPGVIAHLIRSGAVVTNGLTPTQSLYYEASQAHDMMTNAMEDLMGVTYVQAVDYPDNTPTDVASAVSYLVNTMKVSNITMYFIAHGNIELMNVGGVYYYASTLKALIDTYPNVRFNLIFETCHGGSWTDYFQTLGAAGVPNVDMSISSTSRTKGAYPDWDYSSGLTDYNAAQDEFVEFTSDFILQMEYYTATANWPTVTGLTTPALANNKLRLYYLCFTNARNRNYPVAGTPSSDSYVLTERTPISIQEPQIYYQ